MPRTAILSICTSEMKEVGELTSPVRDTYCRRYGYGHLQLYSALDTRPASWSKLPFLLREMRHFDWLMWMDCDVLITNHDIQLDTFFDPAADVIFSEDLTGITPINAGVFLVNASSVKAHSFISQANARRDLYSNRDCEQSALVQQIERNGGTSIKKVPAKLFNCYPQQWQPGDFIFHATNAFPRITRQKASAIRKVLADPSQPWNP